MRKQSRAYALAGWVVIAAAAQGQESVVSPRTVDGFVDVYFSNNANAPTTRWNGYRNFDMVDGQFAFSHAKISFRQPAAPVGYRFDVGAGSTHSMVQTGVPAASALFQQAFFSCLIPVGRGLAVDAGKFVTALGYEVIESKDNWNYSRSFLFAWSIPYYHIGARGSYPVDDRLTVAACIVNGWNGDTDVNRDLTYGVSLNYTTSNTTSLIINGLFGNEQPSGTGSGLRTVGEVILTHRVSDALSLAVDGIAGTQSRSVGGQRWYGAALYGRYRLTDVSAVAARLEVFDDAHGFATGTMQTLKELTLTYEYLFGGSLLTRVEVRHDVSTGDVFDTSTGPASGRGQSTLALGTVVTF